MDIFGWMIILFRLFLKLSKKFKWFKKLLGKEIEKALPKRQNGVITQNIGRNYVKTSIKTTGETKRLTITKKIIGEFTKSWDGLSKQQKSNGIKALLKEFQNNQALSQHWEKMKKIISQISQKKLSGRKLTNNQQQLLDMFGKFFLDDNNIICGPMDSNGWKNLHSSWLIRAQYNKTTKIMLVDMKRGTMTYPFYNVPEEAFLLLATTPSHAGTLWWEKWFWKYSASNWKRHRV